MSHLAYVKSRRHQKGVFHRVRHTQIQNRFDKHATSKTPKSPRGRHKLIAKLCCRMLLSRRHQQYGLGTYMHRCVDRMQPILSEHRKSGIKLRRFVCQMQLQLPQPQLSATRDWDRLS